MKINKSQTNLKKAIIVHLYEGYPEYCWYPSVKRDLEKLGLKVYVPQMPKPNFPDEKKWVSTLKKVVGMPNKDTYLIGHSIGAVTILRYLEQLPKGIKIAGVILVAGFTDDMGYEEFSNFFTKPFNFEAIKRKVNFFSIIASDDDPYIDLKYGRELSEKLNGVLLIKKGMKHMSKDVIKLPDVINLIKKNSKKI